MNNNSDKDNFSIDSILSDIARMKSERGDSSKANTEDSDRSVEDAISEIDRLLGDDMTSLEGFSDYSEQVFEPIPDASQKVPDIETDKNGQDVFGAFTAPAVANDFEDVFSDSHTAPENTDWTQIVELVKNGGSQIKENEPSDIEKTKIIGNASPAPKAPKTTVADDGMVDGQIILQGFIDEEILAPLDEKQAEKELNERRMEKLKKFSLYKAADAYEPDLPVSEDLFDEEEKPGEENYNEDEERTSLKEYRHSDQKMNFGKMLQEDRRSAFLSGCGLVIAEIALIVMSVLSKGADGTAQTVYLGICLLLLSVCAALSVSNIISGFNSLFKLKPNCNSAASIMLLVTLIHTVVSFIVPDAPGGIYCAAAGLSLLLAKVAELFRALGVLENFKFCAFANSDNLYAVKSVESRSESLEIAKALSIGEPDLKYSQKTRFPSKFFENSDFTCSADRLCKVMIPGALILSLITALAAWIKTKMLLGALSALTASLCISLPAGAAFAVIVPVVIAMLSLNKRGGMIASPLAATETANTHAVLLDSFELYDAKSCGLDGFKDYKTVRIDDVLLYAAALIMGTKGPLSEAFEDIIGNRDILPPVKSLIYEEKLGISGFIHGQSVLLGNRNLLINHSIEAPPKTVEMKHLQQGKRVLFIAIGNKIAAMLVLNYIENENLTKPLQVIEKNGISILVNSVDCNITEEFINEGFSLTPGNVRLISPESGKLFRARRNGESASAPAKVLHTGSTESFLRCIATSAVINGIQKISALAQIGFCALGWLILFILMLSKGIDGIGWGFITIYTAVWTALSAGYGIFRTISSGK